MKSFFVFLFCILPFLYGAVTCPVQEIKSFTEKAETRGNSKLIFVCNGTDGTVNFTEAQNKFVLGKRLYSVRCFPTSGGSIADDAILEVVNSRSWDLLGGFGEDLILASGQEETSAYNKKMGGIWYPPFDDENGYSLAISNLAGESNFTIEISVVEELR